MQVKSGGRNSAWRRWSGVAAMLSVVLLAGCGGATTASTKTLGPSASAPTTTGTIAPAGPSVTTITVTGKPLSGPGLAWRQIALPSGFGLQFHVSDVEPAPSNGAMAYACAPVPAQPPSQAYMVVTKNAGASFGAQTRIGSGWQSCAQIVVDELQPNRAVVFQDIGTKGYVTSDGGATWQPFPGPYLLSMVTAGTTTYGIEEDVGGSSASLSLVASSDGLRTWHTIALPAATSGDDIDHVWAQANGRLLIQTGSNNAPPTLWRSSSGGGSWSAFPTPANFGVGDLGESATAGGAWIICGDDGYLTSGIAQLVCTMDSGAHWTILPQFAPASQVGLTLAGVTASGTVLATANANGTGTGLYRWSPGTTRWQLLDPIPPTTATVRYCASAQGGVIWAFVAESDGAGNPGPPNAIYSAPYPAA